MTNATTTLRLSAAQIEALRRSQIGTADTRRPTCAALCKLGLFRFAGGGEYVGQSRFGRSRYAEHVYNRTERGEQVARQLGLIK